MSHEARTIERLSRNPKVPTRDHPKKISGLDIEGSKGNFPKGSLDQIEKGQKVSTGDHAQIYGRNWIKHSEMFELMQIHIES